MKERHGHIRREGQLFIFSAPSGGGKSSVIKGILQQLDNIQLSVSVTTRQKREGEKEGKDYYFVEEEQFKQLVKKGALYEYVDSDFGPKYGTPKAPVDKLLNEGKDVIMDLDYPGVKKLRELAGDKVKAIALLLPSLKILRERLEKRGTDTSEVIERRMQMAVKRIKEAAFYDYIVVNDDLNEAIKEATAIIVAARAEMKGMSGLNEFLNILEKENDGNL